MNPKLDLVLDRVVDVPVELMWKAWTTPEHLVHWFVPAPWSVKNCKIDLRPGGEFSTVMVSPDGQEFPNVGCYLEVVPNARLVFTDTLLPGYRPSANPFFTAILEMEKSGKGTRYIATAIHGNEEARKKHEDMGFHGGWGTVLDQLVTYSRKM
jgi:uncharacterized protein YndB with AHSA1/START domain